MQEGKTWPIATKATQSGSNGSRDHLTRENETGAPSEELLVQSFLNKEIAARLDLSVATVETYRKNVAAKLGVSGSELVRLATLYRTFSWHEGSRAAA